MLEPTKASESDLAKRRITRADCLAAAATLLAESSLRTKWSHTDWAKEMSNEVRQLADRIFEDYQTYP